MLNFFKNKAIGYYIVAVDIILAVILGILFFSTYTSAMASNAAAHVPEVIGMFALLGALIDIVALLLPEFIWIHVIAIGAYCVSLMKQVYCIPNLIADEVNQVHYQGGDLKTCVVWLVITIILIVSAIVAVFLGLLKQDAEDQLKKEKLGKAKIIKIASGGGAVIVAFAVIMVTYGSMALAIQKGSGNTEVKEKDPFKQRIEKRLKEFTDKVDESYDFKPEEFELTEDSNPYKDDLGSISGIVGNYDADQVRKDEDENIIHKVYVFEGLTTEGWQGDYSPKYAYITLWEDGLYNGSANGDKIYGYWYNRDDEGEECLVMMSHNGNNDMVANKLAGTESYYEWSVDVKASYNQGRLIKASGLKYYPIIGMFVDTGSDSTPQFKKDSSIDKSKWTCLQVRNNLVAGSIFDSANKVKWSAADMSTVGKQTITATWKMEGEDWTTDVEIEIVE